MPKTTPQQQGLHPEDIKAELKKRNLNIKKVSEQLDCSANSVRLVIHNKQQSKRIADHIATLIEKETSELWPGQYDYKQRPSYKERRIPAEAA